ncbi:DUF2840 domain-containing protein [Acetobacter nitrogenifigens]|nr:DUF2840 domain-containing protein [Acetobacter nitrogenifigens]
MVNFAHGSVFSFVRRVSDAYGTIESHIDIMRR